MFSRNSPKGMHMTHRPVVTESPSRQSYVVSARTSTKFRPVDMELADLATSEDCGGTECGLCPNKAADVWCPAGGQLIHVCPTCKQSLEDRYGNDSECDMDEW